MLQSEEIRAEFGKGRGPARGALAGEPLTRGWNREPAGWEKPRGHLPGSTTSDAGDGITRMSILKKPRGLTMVKIGTEFQCLGEISQGPKRVGSGGVSGIQASRPPTCLAAPPFCQWINSQSGPTCSISSNASLISSKQEEMDNVAAARLSEQREHRVRGRALFGW